MSVGLNKTLGYAASHVRPCLGRESAPVAKGCSAVSEGVSDSDDELIIFNI